MWTDRLHTVAQAFNDKIGPWQKSLEYFLMMILKVAVLFGAGLFT